jgi:stalled ribosome rescue protein Dom34
MYTPTSNLMMVNQEGIKQYKRIKHKYTRKARQDNKKQEQGGYPGSYYIQRHEATTRHETSETGSNKGKRSCNNSQHKKGAAH